MTTFALEIERAKEIFRNYDVRANKYVLWFFKGWYNELGKEYWTYYEQRHPDCDIYFVESLESKNRYKLIDGELRKVFIA